LRLWQELLRRRPDRIGVRRSLAWLLYELGRTREAEHQFRLILTQQPGDPEASDALERIKDSVVAREKEREKHDP